jgi:predicted DNA-binding transcriptional regulator AlpA
MSVMCTGEILLAKIDRIPEAWPLLMSDVVSARFLDMSKSTFLSFVRSKRLPAPRKIAGSNLVRWHRDDLTATAAKMFGLVLPNDPHQSISDGSDWMEAIDAR